MDKILRHAVFVELVPLQIQTLIGLHQCVLIADWRQHKSSNNKLSSDFLNRGLVCLIWPVGLDVAPSPPFLSKISKQTKSTSFDLQVKLNKQQGFTANTAQYRISQRKAIFYWFLLTIFQVLLLRSTPPGKRYRPWPKWLLLSFPFLLSILLFLLSDFISGSAGSRLLERKSVLGKSCRFQASVLRRVKRGIWTNEVSPE